MPAKRGRPAKQQTNGGVTVTLGTSQAAPAQLTREQELEAEVARLRAQVAAKLQRQSAEEYPEPSTSNKVAEAILAIPNAGDWKALPGADFIRNLHNLMVERVPNTVTNDKPYGDGRLITNQKGDKMYMLKGTFGAYGSAEEREARNWYIKLGQLARQLYGDPQQYRKPKPASEDQINGILRPAVDFLEAHNLVTINENA